MSNLTDSEKLFQDFCNENRLDSCRVPEGTDTTPDFHLKLGGFTIAVEIKEISRAQGFNLHRVSSRTVGSHVRQRISDARPQLQAASRSGTPAILLIYNAVDPMQLFGTEEHDFTTAMYGELTVQINKSDLSTSELFHGRNALLREKVNTSFSGVGHLARTRNGPAVVVYENVYAANPLPFSAIPECIRVMRVSINAA